MSCRYRRADPVTMLAWQRPDRSPTARRPGRGTVGRGARRLRGGAGPWRGRDRRGVLRAGDGAVVAGREPRVRRPVQPGLRVVPGLGRRRGRGAVRGVAGDYVQVELRELRRGQRLGGPGRTAAGAVRPRADARLGTAGPGLPD